MHVRSCKRLGGGMFKTSEQVPPQGRAFVPPLEPKLLTTLTSHATPWHHWSDIMGKQQHAGNSRNCCSQNPDVQNKENLSTETVCFGLGHKSPPPPRCCTGRKSLSLTYTLPALSTHFTQEGATKKGQAFASGPLGPLDGKKPLGGHIPGRGWSRALETIFFC